MKVLIHYDQPELFLDLIHERVAGAEIECCTTHEGLAGALAAFAPEVVFSTKFGGGGFPREALVSDPGPRWIHVGGVGVDHLVPWDAARLTVTNSAGLAGGVMAQYVQCAVLGLALGFPRFSHDQAARRWRAVEVASVEGRTAVIVGLGHTGREVARRLRGAGLRVIGVRARPRPQDGVDKVYGPDGLEEALGQADFVVVSVPLTERTRHLIGRKAIAAIKPGAALIDVSRGGVVDGRELARALRTGHLGGAVLDVFEIEPLPRNSPLWRLENVIVTPHASSTFAGWQRAAAAMFCTHLERWAAGQTLPNVVDPERGY